MWDANCLGEESFGTFWVNQGWNLFEHIIEEGQVENFFIMTDSGVRYTFDQFFNKLEFLKIRR